MDKTPIYDVAVIGGGIVGLATAMALSDAHRLSLVVLEAEPRLAAHQTGNNSGVIHSGLYYKPGSLKAQNCTQGRELLYQFCAENGIPHERCGKIVVAIDESQSTALDNLLARGIANGLTGIKRLNRDELKEFEPHVTGISALFIPDTGIVDYIKVTEKYAEKVTEKGGRIKLGHRVTGISRQADRFILKTSQGDILCRHLINCAGLYSDRIARLSGVNPGLKIVGFRGEYYKLSPAKEYLVKNLVYPVPDPRFPFLGVHFTRMVRGGVEAGPNAVLALKREGYKKTSFSWHDFSETILYPGFWRMAGKYWKMGFGEMYRSFSKRSFVKALQKMIPEVAARDLVPGGAGVRAQALEPDGFLVDDFRIAKAPQMIHVLNAPSPAATASISIGRAIARGAAQDFNLP